MVDRTGKPVEEMIEINDNKPCSEAKEKLYELFFSVQVSLVGG